jgi:hypothetical protein
MTPLPTVVLTGEFGGAIVPSLALDNLIVAARWLTTCCD